MTTPFISSLLLTRKQQAARCGISLRTLDELLSKGVLPFFKIGKSIRFDPAEVDAALRAHFHVAPQLADKPQAADTTTSASTTTALISKGGRA